MEIEEGSSYKDFTPFEEDEEFKEDVTNINSLNNSPPSSKMKQHFQLKIEGMMKAEHNLIGKKALIPRTTLKSHFDSIREV